MIIKTLFLGLLSASAAGSVMYFGTLPADKVNAPKANATDTASDSATNTLSVKTPEAETVKRLPSLRDTIMDKRVERGPRAEKMAEAKTDDVQISEPPKKRWLDQYLKNRDKAEPSSPDDVVVDEPAPKAEPEAKVKPEPTAPTPPADMLNDIIGTSDTKTNEAPRFFKIEDGVLIEVKRDEVEQTEQYESYPRGMASDDRIIAVAFEEAGRISKPELRDQAYFGILEYALRKDNFVEAEKALAEIQQVDMSYTAKSRIAVAFAQKGLSGMAFKTINTVDEPELRDFMRLQVIEAMIAPERLPSQWQDNHRQN